MLVIKVIVERARKALSVWISLDGMNSKVRYYILTFRRLIVCRVFTHVRSVEKRVSSLRYSQREKKQAKGESNDGERDGKKNKIKIK